VILATGVAAALAGCRSVETYPTVRLEELALARPGGDPIPWTEAASPLPSPAFGGDLLLHGRFYTPHMSGDVRWLQPYDFNGDDMVDAGELTHAWVVTAANARSETAYAPGDLRRLPDGADGPAEPVPVRGFALPASDQQVVRRILDRSELGRERTAALIDWEVRQVGSALYLGGVR